MKEGEVVVLTNDNAPPGSWITGRMIKVHLAKDGQVRSVEMNTLKRISTRPVVKLVVVDVKDNEHLLITNQAKRKISMALFLITKRNKVEDVTNPK